jgi:hypothetical protein
VALPRNEIDSSKNNESEPAEQEDAGSTQLLHPVLISCELDRNFPTKDSDPQKVERFYEAAIRPIHAGEDTTRLIWCEFGAGENLEEQKLFNLRATYVLGYRPPKDANESYNQSLIEQLVTVTAWPMFRDLFSHMVSQSFDDLPSLLSKPDIKWLPKDDTDVQIKTATENSEPKST